MSRVARPARAGRDEPVLDILKLLQGGDVLCHQLGPDLLELVFQRLDLPSWLEVPLAVALLDYTLYLWHVLVHKVPFLWRFHQVHHVDLGHLSRPRLRAAAHRDLMELAMEMSANEFIREPLPGKPIVWNDFQRFGIQPDQPRPARSGR